MIKQHHDTILNMYEEGYSTHKIGKAINKNQGSVAKYIKSVLGVIRTQSEGAYLRETKYTKDINYFEKIDTNQKAYFLGLLVADGCNDTRGSGQISINLIESDVEILLKLKEELKYSGDLKYVISKSENHKNQYRFVVASNKISKDLEKWGVVLGKDFKTYFPPIEEKFWNHFIRGVFDGDGCIHLDKNRRFRFYITGNKRLMEEIQNILIEKCSIGKNRLHNHANNSITKRISIGGNKQIKRIRDFLYENEEGFSIERKKQKFFSL